MRKTSIKAFFISSFFLCLSCIHHEPLPQNNPRKSAHLTAPSRHPTSATSFELLDEEQPQTMDHLNAAWPPAGLLGLHENSTDGDDQGHDLAIDQVLAQAHSSIDVEIYEFADPTTLQDIVTAQTEHQVKVRIVKDPNPVNSSCDWFNRNAKNNSNEGCQTQWKFIDQMTQQGAQIVPFKKSELCGQFNEESPKDHCFEHGKMILIDRDSSNHRLALMSTGNFNPSNLCRRDEKPSTCNRDYTYVTRDHDVINGLTEIFDQDFKQTKYDLGQLILQSPYSSKATVSPYSRKPLVELINSAEHTIWIENQYMKHVEINQALKEAAHRGVEVKMVLASVSSFGTPKDSLEATETSLFTDLEKANIQMKFFNASNNVGGHKGYLHAKAMVIDDKIAWMGSVNGSESAVDENREYGIVFHDPQQIGKLKFFIQHDFEDPQSETWQQSLVGEMDHKMIGVQIENLENQFSKKNGGAGGALSRAKKKSPRSQESPPSN